MVEGVDVHCRVYVWAIIIKATVLNTSNATAVPMAVSLAMPKPLRIAATTTVVAIVACLLFVMQKKGFIRLEDSPVHKVLTDSAHSGTTGMAEATTDAVTTGSGLSTNVSPRSAKFNLRRLLVFGWMTSFSALSSG